MATVGAGMRVTLRYATTADLAAAYLPFIQQDALFVATTDVLPMGTELELKLQLPDQSMTVVFGRVVWRVPVVTEMFDHIGVGVQLIGSAGIKIAQKIKNLLDEKQQLN
ncbi:pilus assembly protein PilZ [Piscirickettsia salmonis]|uniref:pilus assembly protein PilZ n=1 Tax=Piscirickettsia salmonis TaxID=1238 RepID=UPI003753D6D5